MPQDTKNLPSPFEVEDRDEKMLERVADAAKKPSAPTDKGNAF